MTTDNKLRFTLILKMNQRVDALDAARRQSIIEEIKQRLTTGKGLTDVEEINTIEFQFAEGPVEMEDGTPIPQARTPYPTTDGQ